MHRMSMGERIKGARLARGYAVAAEFARDAGVSKQYLGNLEKNRVEKPDANQLVKIARAASVTVDWIMTGEGLPSRTSSLSPEESEHLAMLRSLSDDKRTLVLTMVKSAFDSLK